MFFGDVQHHMLFLWSLNSCLEFWTADLSPSSSPSSGLMSHPARPLYPSIAAGPCTSSFILIVFTFSSEKPATAADRCAFHTLFVSLFCHSRQRQQSSLITSDPHAACFCLPRLHFSPTCWQCSCYKPLTHQGLRADQTNGKPDSDIKVCLMIQRARVNR